MNKQAKETTGTIMEPIRFGSPLNDLGFKLLFMEDGAEVRLMSLINSMLNLIGKNKIIALTIMPQEQIAEKIGNKRSWIDVKCKDAKGNQFIVEVQRGVDKHFIKRLQYYSAKSLTSQIKSAEKYGKLMPVTVLAILDYVLFPRKPDYINFFRTQDVKTGEHDFDLQSYCTVEVEKYRKHPDIPHSKAAQHWVDMIAYAHVKTDMPKNIETEIKQAYEIMERSKWSDARIEAYDKAEMQRISFEENMDIRYEEGHAKGAFEERKKAEKDKHLMVRNMADKKLNNSSISEITGFTLEEIQKILKG